MSDSIQDTIDPDERALKATADGTRWIRVSSDQYDIRGDRVDLAFHGQDAESRSELCLALYCLVGGFDVPADRTTIPLEIATAGKPAIATYLQTVQDVPADDVAAVLDVSKQTVYQYATRVRADVSERDAVASETSTARARDQLRASDSDASRDAPTAVEMNAPADPSPTADAAADDVVDDDRRDPDYLSTATEREIADVLSAWRPGRSVDERETFRDAGRDVLSFLADSGIATRSEFIDALYPDAARDGQNPDSWYRVVARRVLDVARDQDVVDRRGNNYHWTGDDE